MKVQMLNNILTEKHGDKYDVAVMYSGGKDSAYLIYMLKKIYNLRVIAVMVDNGYEHDYIWDIIKKYTDGLDVPLKVIKPDRDCFATMFNTLITERKYFEKPGVNHICFICNNLLWCNVMKYAKDNNIPYVASGLSLAQLNSGRAYPLEQNEIANRIAEKSTRVNLKNLLESFRKTEHYKNNTEFREYLEQFAGMTNKVTTVYPYIYHNISLDELKDTLAKLGWQPPKPVGIEQYISSGCIIMSAVVGELEKLGLITLNEREQAKAMVESGLMDQKELEFANYDAKKDIVNLTNPLLKELGIKDYLKNICVATNHQYIE